MKIRKLLFLTFFAFAGCASGGGFLGSSSPLEIHSMGLDRVVLKTNCSTIVCTKGFANEGDIWMTDIPLDKLAKGNFTDGQIIHLQVLWTPLAGKTPLASTSTNLAIKHIIISEGNIGIYGGGGYCWNNGNPDEGMQLYIEDATIAIQNHSPSFQDILTPATMNGVVKSMPNSAIAQQIASAALSLQ
jgi:hypothetical protein